MTEYHLEPRSDASRRVVSAWLVLGLAALVGAGIFSVLLILARTPAIQERIPLIDFFRIALVVHVNLSVLIWLLAISGAMWRMAAHRDRPVWDWLSFGLAAGGTTVVALSPFAGAGDPLMNNYVPVLRHPLFHIGLILFALGIATQLPRSLAALRGPLARLDGPDALRFGIALGGLVTSVALAALIGSWAGLPTAMGGEVYFEYLFWGSGHVLQFTHTLMMMIAWIVLLQGAGMRFELTPRLTLNFLTLLALPVLTVPFLYLAHDPDSVGHRLAFTELMKYGGLSCLPLGFAVLVSVVRSGRPGRETPPEARYMRLSLLASMLLFAVGGLLGFLISGLDIVIPAHYHGSTVGVTIAFMGLTYYLLPRLGFGWPAPRLTSLQPLLYGGGQLLHILGLAWTGGYGVQRKTAGMAQGVDRVGEIAGMGLMGLGGLISVIGGLLFLVICYRSLRQRIQRPAG